MRTLFWKSSFISFALVFIAGYFYWPAVYSLIVVVPLFLVGIYDMTQKHHTILRNFPLIGHGRYLMEMIRPEINQYFVESNTDGVPFNREQRSVVYQRAKKVTDTVPFGTQNDVYRVGHEWINHSISPKIPSEEQPRVMVGGEDCKKPYSASLFNISAMSYGSLSKTAILALNTGAQLGGFAHNTGEGSVSPYHLKPGGDIIWQVGTGYFGCRSKDGHFSADAFKDKAAIDNIKMIELKLSQGAKPGHGGILPGGKVTQEIADIRGVEKGKTVFSPPYHTAFSTPIELLEFIAKLRELSDGKPIGFKLCIGKRREFFAICKAMLKTGIVPDFITVDGAEGGTGAAPLEFADSIGMPLKEGLIFVDNALRGTDLRKKQKIIVAGKVTTGFDIASKIALGADMCNSARGFMFALGCIQALRCNTNDCPTGVATQDPGLYKGLNVSGKAIRVANYQKNTITSFQEVIAAAGCNGVADLKSRMIMRRVSSTKVQDYAEIYPILEPGILLSEPPKFFHQDLWETANPETFQ